MIGDVSGILRFSKDWQYRSGHDSAFRWGMSEQCQQEFASLYPNSDVTCLRKLAEMITGYGKTMLAYGIFEILRQRDFVDRMLVWVPGDEQRSQFADDEVDAVKLLGIRCPAHVVSKTTSDLIYNRSGDRNVFVATYAQLTDNGPKDVFFKELLGSGHRWMMVPDECHHLAQGNIYAQRLEKLFAILRLYLTATPIRSDRKDLHGVPLEEKNKICKIDYKTGHREEAVKTVVCCNEHYEVMCETAEGKPFPVTTENLKAEKINNFSTYEAKKQLRYNTAYLWNLLLHPALMLSQKRIQNPNQNGVPMHQMLIFAMTCRHASFICDTFRAVCQSVEIPLTCDWVGEGDGFDGSSRNDSENKDIIDRFRNGHLDVLVSVDKVGEGFSVKTASNAIFLNLIGADAKLMQQIGRTLRRNQKIPFSEDLSHIFCGSDSEVAALVRTMEQEITVREKKEGGEGGGGPGFIDIPDITVLSAEHSHREVVSPVSYTKQQVESILSEFDLSFCRKHNLDPVEYYQHLTSRTGRAQGFAASSERSSRERLEAIKSQVNHATSVFAGNILRLKERLHDAPYEFDKKRVAGEVKKAINGEWLRRSRGKDHKSMVEQDWRTKYAWIKEENIRLRDTQELPTWLR
jgi:superfamily II DNA or RNA helicase